MSSNLSGLPLDAPFTLEQKNALSALLPSLEPPQAAWLSGFLAHRAQLRGSVTAASSGSAEPVTLTILFGSESGNAEGCAQKLEMAARKEGFSTVLADMADFDLARLPAAGNLLVVVSTWGEGDPPEAATGFYEQVMGSQAPALKGIRYAVCALGDSSYADFCQCGRDFDRRLGELGAKRVLDRVELDVDFEAPFGEWQQRAVKAMAEASGLHQAAQAGAVTAAATAPVREVEWTKKNPYPALIKARFPLNGPGSKKETLHLELELGDSGMTYEPGDVLGAYPINCPEVIADFIQQAGFKGDEQWEANGASTSLRELLATYDITSLSKPFMNKYRPLAGNEALDRFLDETSREQLAEWLWGRELRDLFREFPPAAPLTVEQLLGILRTQPPRLYSIASSLRAHPGEVHLTIASVRYAAHGWERKGVCSTYFADRVGPGETVPVYLHHNKNFKLPADPATPIIMVGPGTGIAPFRAFVEERVAVGATGKSWLFFGDWTFQDDFLYQLEWQKYLKSGALGRMDVAFSRDTEHKVYVQHRMKERARDLYAWLEEGAHFYVCGDAKRMAKDVHQTLIDVVAAEGGRSPEEAEAYVKQLQKDKRYQRDVY